MDDIVAISKRCAESAHEPTPARDGVGTLTLECSPLCRKTKSCDGSPCSARHANDSLASVGIAWPGAVDVRSAMIARPQTKPERRLVAIFAADAADYSRLMGEDEVETLRVLMAHRELMESLIVEHRGRVANMAGDSVLAEFPSAVDAVQCAIAVQQRLAQANDTLPDDRRLEFRIGVNVGDVMIQRGDLFGDRVNIAARLQALAEPGGLCLSAEAHAHIRRLLPLAFEDLGLQQVKNIDEPVRVYSYRARSSGLAPESYSTTVFPFANAGGERRLLTAGVR